MKMEDHFKETLNRAVANEPPVLDAWDRLESRVQRGRRTRLFAAIAAAAAVAVASVIVVPRLGTSTQPRLPFATSPPPSSPIVDRYAGWSSDTNSFPGIAATFRLRYPPRWTHAGPDEGVFTYQPPGVEPAAKGEPTFFVSVKLDVDEALVPPPEGDDGTYRRGIWTDGRTSYRSETEPDGAHIVTYRIDWTDVCDTAATSCAGRTKTLVIIVRGETPALWRDFGAAGEDLAASVTAQTGSASPSP